MSRSDPLNEAPAAAVKAPRRTAERILEAAQGLFNRFGEPNVSTVLIAAELHISAGNLHYHYPAKEALVNRLADRYAIALTERLRDADDVRDVAGAWQLVHRLLQLNWQYRFLWRDLNDLLSRNRRLETQFQALLKDQRLALRAVLDGLRRCQAFAPPGIERMQFEPLAETMLVLLSYWLSHEYVRDPRQALEPPQADAALRRGTQQVLAVLLPYLTVNERAALAQLSSTTAAAAAPANAG